MRTFLTTLAFLAAFGLMTAGVAYAGEDCCCDKAKAKTGATATKTPIHSMMKWVSSQVAPELECGCPTTEAGEKAWRTWYAAKGGALADLRAAMIKDGWNADRTIGFFKAMAAQKSCGSCDKSATTSGAAAPTGDAGATGDAKGKDCSGCCDKNKDCSGCCGDKAKSKCCGGCDKSKKASGAAAPTGDAGTTGDAKGKDCSGCCGDKAKSKCCGGCDKSKKASGAAAPTGDAGATGDAQGGCDGGKTCDCCGGCDKNKAKTVSTATKSPIHTMMKWVGSQVAPDLDCACPAKEKGEMAWRAWFVAKDAPLSGLRAAMVKDGWNADRTVAFFKAMGAKKSCSDCNKDCSGCDKSSAKGAAAPTGDAGTTGDSKCPCTGKPMKDCNGCGKSTCPCGKKEKAASGK